MFVDLGNPYFEDDIQSGSSRGEIPTLRGDASPLDGVVLTDDILWENRRKPKVKEERDALNVPDAAFSLGAGGPLDYRPPSRPDGASTPPEPSCDNGIIPSVPSVEMGRISTQGFSQSE